MQNVGRNDKLDWQRKGKAAPCNLNLNNMTFETETYFTLTEYKNLYRKLLFKKRAPWLLLIAAFLSAIMLVLNWVGLIAELDSSYQTVFFFFVAVGCAIFFTAFGLPEKQYNSNKMMQENRVYIFDDEKLCYNLRGADGNIAWEYIIRYDHVDNYLMLYTAERSALFVKIDKLNAQQINFIKSKVQMPERLANVKPIV